MSTRPSDRTLTVRRQGRGRRTPLARVGVTGVLALLLAACSPGSGDPQAGGVDPVPPGAAAPQPAAPAAPSAPTAAPGPGDPLVPVVPPGAAASRDVVAGLQQVLQARATAVAGGDQAGFLAGVATDPAFRAAQEVWFANLSQLPRQLYALTPDPASVVRAGAGAYWVNVQVSLQLQGFDTAPVTTVDRYLFRSGPRGGRLRLASTTDPEWEARNGVQAPPWETGPLLVRSAPGVLGLFDVGSEPASARLLRSVSAGIGAVSDVVPYPWSRTVVLIALSDDTFLRSLPDLPGSGPDAPDAPDAVAYPVRSEVAAGAALPVTTVGTRLALQPRLLGRGGPGRDRLLRHELTHVALGERDDHVPRWLGEGLAELVSVQAEPPTERRVQPAALAAARAGLTRLPEEAGFSDRSVAEDYGVSWWACEYVAATAGPAALWALLDRLEPLGAQSPTGVADAAQQDAALTALAGVDTRTLARKAGKLLVATVEPPAPVTPAPMTPSATPLATPLPTPTPAPAPGPGVASATP